MSLNPFEGQDRMMEIESSSKYYRLVAALNALIGQAGECDGYIACIAINHEGNFYVQGDIFKDISELLDWYRDL